MKRLGGGGKHHAENETDGITLSPTKLYSTLQGAVKRMAVPSRSTSWWWLLPYSCDLRPVSSEIMR